MGWDKMQGIYIETQDHFHYIDGRCNDCGNNKIKCEIMARIYLFKDKFENYYTRVEIERLNHEFVGVQSLFHEKEAAILVYQEARKTLKDGTKDIKRELCSVISQHGRIIESILCQRSLSGFFFERFREEERRNRNPA